jgi:adenosine kinase
LIVNRGQRGALIYTGEICHQIPGHQAKAIHDSSGGDDAFCAGLLYGLNADIDWETAGRVATLMWSLKIEHHGTQSHSFTLPAFKALFRKIFGYALLA